MICTRHINNSDEILDLISQIILGVKALVRPRLDQKLQVGLLLIYAEALTSSAAKDRHPTTDFISSKTTIPLKKI